jgi:hypothetical protein
MSDDSIEPGIDDQLIGDFLVERATINPARSIEHNMIICPLARRREKSLISAFLYILVRPHDSYRYGTRSY